MRAWIGGRDFLAKNQFDHVSMARRENGALLQPVIYGLAFDKLGLNPALDDQRLLSSIPTAPATPADLALGNPDTDLTKRFLSVQDALALGNRAAATRVGLQLGPQAVTDWLRARGWRSASRPGKPNVFNPEPMTLGDMASLYQVLGNDGMHRKLKIIQSITSQNGQVLYDDSKPDRDEDDRLLDIVDDEQMTLTLQNALRTGFARTLTRDYDLRAPIAGMPGYSEGYRDAWFVGYTPKLLAGVWVGLRQFAAHRREGRRGAVGRAALGRHHARGAGAHQRRHRFPRCRRRSTRWRSTGRPARCAAWPAWRRRRAIFSST